MEKALTNFDDIKNFHSAIKIIRPIVEKVRELLAAKYDVSEKGKYPNYQGLCHEASMLVCSEINGLGTNPDGIRFMASTIHGEQKHTPKIMSTDWPIQHTWCEVYDRRLRGYIYVDATCGQFKDIYDDIPDYYIAVYPPKWFYPDRKNPAWRGFTKKLNRSIQIPFKPFPNNDYVGHEGIIEALQYRVWGNISDLIFVWLKTMGKKR